MSTLIERARKWGEERDQLWLQKGIEKGIEMGIEEGIERGIQESLERTRQLMHRQVSCKFGPGTAEQLLPILERISDQEDIFSVADAVIDCETAEEFLSRVQQT